MAKPIETSIDIAASPGRVWQVLTDFQAYPDWNPYMVEIQGVAEPAARLVVKLAVPAGPPIRLTPTVTVAEAERELRWTGQLLAPGLFDGDHWFTLEPLPGGRTRLAHGETFAGVFMPMFRPLVVGHTRAGFNAMNRALKARAEAG